MFKLLKDGTSIQVSSNKVVDNNKSVNVVQNGFIEKRSVKTEVMLTSTNFYVYIFLNIQTV